MGQYPLMWVWVMVWVHFSRPILLRFHHAMIYLTFVFFYEYARGCYALNGCVTFSRLAYLVFPFPVSHATGSCTRTFPSLFHMFSYLYECGLSTRLRLLVLSPFPFYVCRLVYLRFSLTSFSFLSRRLIYAFPLQFVDSSPDSLFLDSDSSPVYGHL